MPSAVGQQPAVSPLAGLAAPEELLIDVARLEREYYARQPDLADPNQLVSFGTSGHRGCPLHGSFTEAHILAITQALCDYRRVKGIDGPLYIGKDTHALSAPITARTSRDPGQRFHELEAEFGTPYYTRIDSPATPQQRARLGRLSPDAVKESVLAGEAILAKLTRAPGNNAPISGLKVVAAGGWFAARPSGTENVYKIYAESFHSEDHLEAILGEAREIVNHVLAS